MTPGGIGGLPVRFADVQTAFRRRSAAAADSTTASFHICRSNAVVANSHCRSAAAIHSGVRLGFEVTVVASTGTDRDGHQLQWDAPSVRIAYTTAMCWRLGCGC